tara:strand:- start:67 stop:1077 length:1011 start_codon:yes stop_codon:yes gene_type:complete
MAALTVAKNNLVKGMAPMEGLLKDLLKREFITQDAYDRVKADEDFAHYFKPKAKAKKTSAKKAPKTSASKEEKNKEKFDDCRCFARKWESDGGLGYDNIQCSSCKKVPADEAEKVMDEFKKKMDEDQLARLPEYLEKYDGCFCKNHLKQDFFMPNGWWLGKANEPRPEKPMLPKGSFKDGYQEDYKEHRWMYDEEGNKNERVSNRGRTPKKLVIEDDEEPKVEKEEPKVEEVEQVEEEGPKVEEEQEVEDVAEEDTLKLPEEEKEEEKEEEEDHEEKPHMVDGVEYTLMWDEDDKEWLVTFDDEHVGWPGNGGAGIRFADDEEEEAHAKRVAEKEE